MAAGEREHAQLMKRLNLCLKRPENLVCVDCPMRLPRWASLNLGIFMCTNCSGIHRGLGVHISRVRSTQLDKWTPEQVGVMERMGNVRANVFWEKNLPAGAKPKVSDLPVVERYIRDKYERKMYADRNTDGPTPGDGQAAAAAAAAGAPAAAAASVVAPAVAARVAVPAAAPAAGGGMFDLLDLADPVALAPQPVAASSAGDDGWADFSSAPGAAASAGAWDAFGAVASKVAPVVAPAAFAPVTAAPAGAGGWEAFASAAPATAVPAPSPVDDWGAFSNAPPAAASTTLQVSKNDIMNLFDTPQAGGFGGGMGGQPQQQQQMGGFGGGMSGGGMNGGGFGGQPQQTVGYGMQQPQMVQMGGMQGGYGGMHGQPHVVEVQGGSGGMQGMMSQQQTAGTYGGTPQGGMMGGVMPQQQQQPFGQFGI